jgi:tetratricopeptide (TPR) repeat protein
MEASLKRNPSQLELRDKIDRFQNARIEVATHLLQMNQPDNAYDLIVLIPESVEKYELMAMFYAQQSQFRNAILLYQQLIESVKKDIQKTLERPTENQQRVAMLNQKIKRYEENINQLMP